MKAKAKVRHFIWASLFCCAANFVVGGVLLGVSIYNHNVKKRHISVELVDDWRDLVDQLICFGGCILGIAAISMWCVTKRRAKDLPYAVVVLAAHLGLLIAGICFTTICDDLVDRVPVSNAQLFISTKRAISYGIREHGYAKWTPIWLDEIQTKHGCCGILTFRDYNEFWIPQIRGVKDHVPESCCRKQSTSKQSCLTDLTNIPFPDTVADNIKVDSGCAREINKLIDKFIKETYKFLWLAVIVLAVSLLAFTVQYVFLFYIRPYAKEACELDGTVQDPDVKPDDETNWDTLNFFPANKRFKNKMQYSKQQGNMKPQLFVDESSSTIGGGSTVNEVVLDNRSSTYTAHSNNSTASQDKNRPKPFENINTNSTSTKRNAAPDSGYITNALGYIERVQQQVDDMMYPYQGLNDLKYYDNIGQPGPGGLGAPDVSEPADLVPEDEAYFPKDDVGSPLPPPAAGTTNMDPANILTHKHHAHHRIQVKGVAHGPGGKKHHGHHHNHKDRKDDGQQPL